MNSDISYWENYYKTHTDVTEPSLFAEWVKEYIKDKDIRTIVDVGCGSGRDAYYLGNFYEVTGVDHAVKPVNRNNVSFLKTPMDNISGTYDLVYSRFSLHSVDENTENTLIAYAFNNSKYMAIECRSTKDPLSKGASENREQTSYATKHYRRYISMESILLKMEKMGFNILHRSESDTYAPYRDTSPVCIRIIAERV